MSLPASAIHLPQEGHGVICGNSVRRTEPARSWRWSSTQLEPGELRLDCTGLDLDNISITAATIDRVSVHRLQSPRDGVSLLICRRNAGVVFVCGHELTPARCLCINSGADVDLVAHRDSAFLLITLREDLLRRAAGLVVQRIGGPCARVALLACPIDARAALEDRIGSILQDSLVNRNGDSAAAEVLQRMTTTLLINAAELSTTPARTAGLERARRHAAVERARRYIHEHLADPIQLSDLCNKTHLQARSIEYGFQEVVRLSPMRYVRMLRLGEVRRQILEGATVRRSISEIALDAGFSHLSQFAVDYKKVFAETPSETRQRARPAIESAARARPRARQPGSMSPICWPTQERRASPPARQFRTMVDAAFSSGSAMTPGWRCGTQKSIRLLFSAE